MFSCWGSLSADEPSLRSTPSRPERLEPQTRLVQWIMGRFFPFCKFPLKFLCRHSNASFETKTGKLRKSPERRAEPTLCFTSPTQNTSGLFRDVHKQEPNSVRLLITCVCYPGQQNRWVTPVSGALWLCQISMERIMFNLKQTCRVMARLL